MIEQITVRGVSLTPPKPVQTAAGTLSTTPLVLIDMRTDDAIGHAYLRPYTPLALGPLVDLTANMAELIVGGSAAPARIEAELHRAVALLGRRGLVGAAMAGLDMAAWDALAREVGVPLVRLLGGEPRPVRAYASLRTMDPAAAADEAVDAVARGFTGLKLKVGPLGDLTAIRAVRAAIGDSIALMVDYNQSLTVAEALNRATALDDLGLAWIEEPVSAEDHSGHSRVSQATRTPIQVGENWQGLPDMAASIAAGASDLSTLDAMRIGGVTGWLAAAALAHSAGLPVSSHTFGEFSAHLLAVTPTADWLEYLDHAGEILTEPLSIQDGYATAPDGPGAGVEWDEERLSGLVSVRRVAAA
jgi:mandelate racemase